MGSAATLTVEAVADGATAAQMPELQLPDIDGVQVFAEPVQADERFVDGRPRVKLTRRFSLVPAREGTVRVTGMQMRWWDVRAGEARTTDLPPLSWPVQPGSAGTTAATAPSASPSPDIVGSAATPAKAVELGGANRMWVLATLLFAALWLFTLVWGLHRGENATAVPSAGPPHHEPARAEPGRADLKRAIDRGDLGDVLDALCASAHPPARNADELLARLADPQQRAAVDALLRARWGDGDAVAARAQLRSAFARGPSWHAQPVAQASPLPPLYPPERG